MMAKQASLLEKVDTNKKQVEAIQVCKIYGTGKLKVQALKGVSPHIQRGEVGAITGPGG